MGWIHMVCFGCRCDWSRASPVFWGSDLYAAGEYTTPLGTAASRIDKWDMLQSTWSAVERGRSESTWALQVFDGKLYAGSSWNFLSVYQPVILAGSSSPSIVSEGGDLHLAVESSGKILHRSFDGTTWSASTEIAAGASRDPQLTTRSSNGHTYLHYVESGSLKYRLHDTSNWSAANSVYTGKGITKLICPAVISGSVLSCL